MKKFLVLGWNEKHSSVPLFLASWFVIDTNPAANKLGAYGILTHHITGATAFKTKAAAQRAIDRTKKWHEISNKVNTPHTIVRFEILPLYDAE